jgi:hypothetical protein
MPVFVCVGSDAIKECMVMRADATQWSAVKRRRREEEYLFVQQGLEVLWVVDLLGVGELQMQRVQVDLGDKAEFREPASGL